MVDYRNILRLQSQGYSQREIERELYCSRHTISEVLIRAKAAGIAWPLEDDVGKIAPPAALARQNSLTITEF